MYIVPKYRLSYIKESSPVEPRRIVNKTDVTDFCKKYLSNHPIEIVIVIALDNGNSILGFEETKGATNQCAIYVANCFRFLLCTGASAFILAHNHTGGNLTPSESDWSVTERLKMVGALLELPLLDHVIITENQSISMHDLPRWDKVLPK